MIRSRLRQSASTCGSEHSSSPPGRSSGSRFHRWRKSGTAAAAKRVRELIEDGVDAGAFRAVNAAFAADLIATMMVRIQQRGVATATGLSDAEAYTELATLLTHGLQR